MNTSNSIVTLSMGDLIRSEESYVIPIYQRNYAWGEKEISQLLQDIIDYVPSARNYYLGTLIVFEREQRGQAIYETIDGQQRLTTLYLLVSVLLNEYELLQREDVLGPQLVFDCRPISSHTLHAAHYGKFSPSQRFDTNIQDAYELITRLLRVKWEEYGIARDNFLRFLLEHVKLLRSSVPPDTDLNHYFEIMNNRGEQLEKHEILKARLLETFRHLPDDRKQPYTETFHRIWEACAPMERYVQYGFPVEQRHLLFGANLWSNLTARSFESVVDLVTGQNQHSTHATHYSLTEILAGAGAPSSPSRQDSESPDRFTPISNFSNFLLHVLRIVTRKPEVQLDDKRLLEFFDRELRTTTDPILFVKEFGFALLKCRWLLDTYIIKREHLAGSEHWSLKQFKWNVGNKTSYTNTFGEEDAHGGNNQQTIVMLLSMFHVSTPTQVYKHWLNAALYYLYQRESVQPNDYIHYLEDLAKKFVFGRYLAQDPADYFSMIYGELDTQQLSWPSLDLTRLSFHNIPNNLVFNYVDYLLWKQTEDTRLQRFVFSFRSSVEHYYPQNPLPGIPTLDSRVLHSFGNLCLVSHSKNSRLSNLMPTAKREFYIQNEPDSLKQHHMMNRKEWQEWGPRAILEHEREMLELLQAQLDEMETKTI